MHPRSTLPIPALVTLLSLSPLLLRALALSAVHSVAAHPVPHSFPTRRSSDLCLLPRLHGRALPLRRPRPAGLPAPRRSEEHTSELQSRGHLVCRLLLEKNKLRPGQVGTGPDGLRGVEIWRALVSITTSL